MDTDKGKCWLCDCITDTEPFEVVPNGFEYGLYIDVCRHCLTHRLKGQPDKYKWVKEAGDALGRYIYGKRYKGVM